jgi:hypothetical protein
VDEIRAFGREVGLAVAPRHPELIAEIEGISAGAKQEVEDLLAVNARTELLSAGRSPAGNVRMHAEAAVPECSVIGLLPERTEDGRCYLAQNWDFHPDLSASRVLWTVVKPGCKSFSTFTEAGMLAKIGANASGIAIGLNFLASEDDSPGPRTPVHLLVRLLLECQNATEVLRTLYTEPTSVSVALTVAYTEGCDAVLFSAELGPDRIELVWPDPTGHLVHTNHFLGAGAERDVSLEPDGWHGTLIRKELLDRRLRHIKRKVTRGDVEDLLSSRFNRPQSICARPFELGAKHRTIATLASIIMDVSSQEWHLADGPPDAMPFTHYDLASVTDVPKSNDVS